MKRAIIFVFLSLFLFAGCYSAKRNVVNSAKLRVGMTKAQVLKVMGEPEKNEVFHRPDAWFYYYETNWVDGFVTEDECFPVIFENGKVVGFGNEFYTRYRVERRTKIRQEGTSEKPADKVKKTSPGKAAKKAVKKAKQQAAK